MFARENYRRIRLIPGIVSGLRRQLKAYAPESKTPEGENKKGRFLGNVCRYLTHLQSDYDQQEEIPSTGVEARGYMPMVPAISGDAEPLTSGTSATNAPMVMAVPAIDTAF